MIEMLCTTTCRHFGHPNVDYYSGFIFIHCLFFATITIVMIASCTNHSNFPSCSSTFYTRHLLFIVRHISNVVLYIIIPVPFKSNPFFLECSRLCLSVMPVMVRYFLFFFNLVLYKTCITPPTAYPVSAFLFSLYFHLFSFPINLHSNKIARTVLTVRTTTKLTIRNHDLHVHTQRHCSIYKEFGLYPVCPLLLILYCNVKAMESCCWLLL